MKPYVQMPLTVLVLALLSACGPEHAADPAPAGNLPEVAGKTLGPKPGPGRIASTTTNPLGGDASAPANGRRLFLWFNCYGCHGGRAGGGMGPSLRDATWLYGNKDQDIFNSIAEGRPHGMPAWGTILPKVQIWQLTAYIKSMGTADEPDAPSKNPVFPNPPPRRDVKGVQAGPGDD